MSKVASDVIEIGSFGLIDDPFGIEAGEKAAGKAAGVQERGAQAGIAETRRQFDITEGRLQEAQEFQRAQQQPFQEAGVSALQQQQALLGLSGQDAQRAAFADFEQSPGQKFLQDRAQRNLVRNSSAIGGLGGGNVRSALVQQGVGFAQQDFQNQFGRLGQLSGRGQQAAGAAGQGALTSAGQIGQFGAQAAGNIANLGVAGSEARASGILGKASIAPGVTSGLLQLGGQFAGAAFGVPPNPLAI
jgi:hypothetical protein